jgi:hypothetical protein
MRRLRKQWDDLWFEPVSPLNLGLCRVLFFGGVFLFYLPQDLSAWATVSEVFWKPIGLFRILHLGVLPEEPMKILEYLWKTALALSSIGLFTRVSIAASFFLGVYLIGLPHNFGKVHHDDALLIFIFGIMALSKCGDSCSLDRLRRKKSLVSAPSPEYAWPVRTVWLVLALIFFSAGWAKIRQSGMEWIFSDTFRYLLIQHNYYLSDHDPLTSWGLAVAQYPRVCQLLAAATIAFETTYPLALFSSMARSIVIPGVFLMLVGIRVLMGPAFEPMMIGHIFWIPWDRIARRFVARRRAPIQPDVDC